MSLNTDQDNLKLILSSDNFAIGKNVIDSALNKDGIYRLSPVHDIANQRMSQGVPERAGRIGTVETDGTLALMVNQQCNQYVSACFPG